MVAALVWLGRQGRYCLIAGLLAGLLLPALAEILRPHIGAMIALLLFVTGMRVGARAAFGSLTDIGPAVLRIGALQLVLPLSAVAVFATLGVLDTPLALAVSLMLAAPSVTGAPNFVAMAGLDPAPGVRLLVLGTALFPLTAFPILAIVSVGGDITTAVIQSVQLLIAILVSVGAGFAVRKLVPSLGAQASIQALDGMAALVLAIVVVGLMSAIGPLARSDPMTLVGWLFVAIGVNTGLVLGTLYLARSQRLRIPEATAVYAGNRNIALFLIVLPDAVAAPLMIFIGCYQVPMYLTPLLLARVRGQTG
ncbi:MAG: hypothetical protein AAFQ79_06590 [Pseudomonadota bacterium]